MRRFSLSLIDRDSPEDYFDRLKYPLGVGATEAMRAASRAAIERVRNQVKRNFRNSPHRYKGQDFSKAFRVHMWPRPGGAFDWSYTPAADLVAASSWAHVFEEGAVIPARSPGRPLAIPLQAAEDHGLARSTRRRNADDILEPWKLHQKHSLTDLARERFGMTWLADTPDGGKLVMADDGGRDIALFKLQYAVRMPKLLNFYDAAKWAHRLLPAKFSAEFNKAKSRQGVS